MEFTRSFALEDIVIRSGGDGRTVEAYAAVFNTPTEIKDGFGHYREQIDPSAFKRSLTNRGDRAIPVFYNHGFTLAGTPSERGSVPIGHSIEPPKADGHGLLTVSRYNRSEQADQVLESIKNGDITGQSFSGADVRSGPKMPRGGYRPSASGDLTLVTRHELSLREYGPTPMPSYKVPMMMAVRSETEQAHVREQLGRVRAHFIARAVTDSDRQALTLLLAQLAGADQGIDPIVDALCAADAALDAAQLVVSAMLGVPNPDPDSDMDEESGTGTLPPAADDPHRSETGVHSGRLAHIARIRAAMLVKGIS